MSDQRASARSAIAEEPGKPSFLDHPEMDRTIALVMRLAMEISALRDRVDTHERLGQEAGISLEAVEGYEANSEVKAERDARRKRLIEGLLLDLR